MTVVDRPFRPRSAEGVRRFAVIGRPIAHSLSPEVHRAFAEQTGIPIRYQRLRCADDKFPALLDDFFSQNDAWGVNITTPFKELAYRTCPRLTIEAKLAGSVNTIGRGDDRSLLGHNTDGLGYLRDVSENLGVDIPNARILILGAGATARTLVMFLARFKPMRLRVFNRSLDRLSRFIDEVNGSGLYHDYPPVAFTAERDSALNYDLIVNCTSSAFAGGDIEWPNLSGRNASCIAYDLSYGLGDTDFRRWSENELRCRYYDGVGLLVEQAAYSFAWWNGCPLPNTQKIIADLRARLVNRTD